jgi:carbon monoxide dehydrogenase subunit G
MELTETFTVAATADRLWDLLTDVERIAPCVPGFELLEINDPEYRGTMKVKVGAISMSYDATITFVERDDPARRAVLSVRGKERRGPGGVTAMVTSSLTENGAETTVDMVTDVQVTGRVAQFGRGIIGDVSSRMTEQFVACLSKRLLAPEPETTDGDAPSAAPQPPAPPARPEALDLGAVTAVPILKRALPLALALLVTFVAVSRWRSR